MDRRYATLRPDSSPRTDLKCKMPNAERRKAAECQGIRSTLLGLLLAAGFGASAQTSAPELFARGLTALHHFEYEDANAAFVQARTVDPAFVLAYWGEALTYYQPLWRNENVEAGRQALARLGPTSAA